MEAKLEAYFNILEMYQKKVRDVALDLARNADRKVREAQQRERDAKLEALEWKTKYEIQELVNAKSNLKQPTNATKSALHRSTSSDLGKSWSATTSFPPQQVHSKRPARSSMTLTPSPTRLSKPGSPLFARSPESPENKPRKQPPRSSLKPKLPAPDSDSETENRSEKPTTNHTKSRNTKSRVKKSTMNARVSKGLDLNGDTLCVDCGNYFVGEKGLHAHSWRCPKKPQAAKSSKRPAEKSPSRPTRTNKKKPAAGQHDETIADLVALVNACDDEENDEHDDDVDNELENSVDL